MCNFLVAFGLYLAGSLAPAPGVAAQAEQATRQAPPDAAAQQSLLTQIKEVYKIPLSDAKTASQKVAFSKKLLKDAVATNDDADSRYVLLEYTRELAATNGDLTTAFLAVSHLAARYRVDRHQLYLATVSSSIPAMNTQHTQQQLFEVLVSLIDDAIDDGQYSAADKLLTVAGGCAWVAKDRGQSKAIAERKARLDVVSSEDSKAADATLALKRNANDSEAALVVGRFLCFYKNDWRAGLPVLARAADAKLKEAADLEMSEMPDALKIADTWSKLAEGFDDPPKSMVKLHSLDWYRKAQADLNGLTKARVDKLLFEHANMSTIAGALPSVSMHSVRGRVSPLIKAQLLVTQGGSEDSENAVALGLGWLSDHQFADGSWSFAHGSHPSCKGKCSQDGSLKGGCRTGATGMALLAFLGSGHTHKGGEYQTVVQKGLEFLIKNSKNSQNGLDLCPVVTSNEKMYVHGLCTIALMECAAMTKDPKIAQSAGKAMRFIESSQNPNSGGWRYVPFPGSKDLGDTSVVAWQVMAIKGAHDARIPVSQTTIDAAVRFLNSAQVNGGSQYRYDLSQKTPTPTITAAALLSRMYLGWDRNNKALENGVKYLASLKPQLNNAYYNYYATQVMHHWGGDEWAAWNVVMRDQLLRTQKTANDGHSRGSWDLADPHGGAGGRLYSTCLNVLTLEVYYRHKALLSDISVGVDAGQ